LEEEEKEVLGKIKRKLGEEIRKRDEELLGQIEYEPEFGDEEIIELPEAQFVEVLD